jgi:hypothetical protein
MAYQKTQVKQERFTFEDTILNQQKMIMFLRGKIAGIPHFVDKQEQYDFYKVEAYCFLSQGPFTGIVPVMWVEGKVIPLGTDIHHFANSICFNLTTDRVKLKFRGKEYVVESREVWKVLLKYCMLLFPKSLAEALKMSKEIPRSAATTLGYEFSSERKLENE